MNQPRGLAAGGIRLGNEDYERNGADGGNFGNTKNAAETMPQKEALRHLARGSVKDGRTRCGLSG